MSQVPPRYCPRCGAPLVINSSTCGTCGLTSEAMLAGRGYEISKQTVEFNHDQPLDIDEPAAQFQQYNEQGSMQAPRVDQNKYSPDVTQLSQKRNKPDYAYSPFPKKRSIGRRGFILLLVALLALAGAISYTIAGFLGVPLPGFVQIQPPVTTLAINSTVPYAGIDITVVNAQQSQSFIDDRNSSQEGMVRLNLREHNQTNIKVGWSYENIARLILPDKSLVSPTYINARVAILPGMFQKSVIDFPVPAGDHISQLTLLLGATNEAQMLIPLTANAELGTYQPKTVNLNGQMHYYGLNWTLTSATSSLSINGQQAKKGMRYVTVTLKVDNTLSQVAVTGSSYDFIRLTYGSVTALPKYATLPVAFDPGATGVAGTVSFLVLQNTRSYTLILEPQKEDSGDNASTDFQVI